MKRTLPKNCVLSKGWHFFVSRDKDTGARKWIKLGKVGALGSRHLSADSAAALERILAGDIGGMRKIFNRYAREILPQKAKKTAKDQARQLGQLIAVFGHAEPGEVMRAHIARYLDKRAETAPVAGNREIALLSDVFTVAIRWGLCEINPCTGVRRNKERPRTRAIGDVEFHAFRATVPPLVQDAMDLALLTGQRLGDVLKMRLSHCTDQGIEVRQGKTGKALVVCWSDELADVVARCKARTKANKVTSIDPALIGITASGFHTAWQRAQVLWGEAKVVSPASINGIKGKLIELSKLCELLALEQSDTPEAHYAEAAAIARELWPVRAKPLAWSECAPGLWAADDYMVIDHDEGRFKAQWLKTMLIFDSPEKAKAACEADHQARFLERLA